MRERERDSLMTHQIKKKLGKPIKRDKLNTKHAGVQLCIKIPVIIKLLSFIQMNSCRPNGVGVQSSFQPEEEDDVNSSPPPLPPPEMKVKSRFRDLRERHNFLADNKCKCHLVVRQPNVPSILLIVFTVLSLSYIQCLMEDNSSNIRLQVYLSKQTAKAQTQGGRGHNKKGVENTGPTNQVTLLFINLYPS